MYVCDLVFFRALSINELFLHHTCIHVMGRMHSSKFDGVVCFFLDGTRAWWAKKDTAQEDDIAQ